MSTRGGVAWLDSNGEWRGVYNHSDSYPTGLGIEVLREAKGIGIGNLKKELQAFGDWREYKNAGVCEYCGERRGQAINISGIIVAPVRHIKKSADDGAVDAQTVLKNISDTAYPDPEARHHEHSRTGPASHFDPRKDPLFMEWVYLLKDGKPGGDASVEIWAHAHVPRGHPGAVKNGKRYYGHALAFNVREAELVYLTDNELSSLADDIERLGNSIAYGLGEDAVADDKARGVK